MQPAVPNASWRSGEPGLLLPHFGSLFSGFALSQSLCWRDCINNSEKQFNLITAPMKNVNKTWSSQKFSRILLPLVLLKMLCVSGCFLLCVQMELTAGSIYQPCHILHSVQSCFPFVLFFLWEDLCPLTVSPRSVCCPWACSRAAEMPACLANRACFHIGIGLCLLLERNNFP